MLIAQNIILFESVCGSLIAWQIRDREREISFAQISWVELSRVCFHIGVNKYNTDSLSSKIIKL